MCVGVHKRRAESYNVHDTMHPKNYVVSMCGHLAFS